MDGVSLVSGVREMKGKGREPARARDLFVWPQIPPAPRDSARWLSGRDLPRCSSVRLIELELTVRWLSAKPEYPECYSPSPRGRAADSDE